jgi:hypothetical protein
MKKLVLSALVLVLVFALAGYATNTRVMTMGDANNIVKDDANIWLYPSTINMYPDMAIGEFASMNFESLGMHYAVGDNGTVLGAYLSTLNEMGMYNPNVMDPMGGNAGVDHKINLFFGTPMGDNLFGASLGFYGDSWSIDGDDTDQRAMSNMMIDLALGLTLNENFDLAAGFGYATWTNEDIDGNTVTEPDGNMWFGIGGRYWMDFGGDYTGVPHAAFMYDTEGWMDEAGDNGEKVNTMGFDLGWGMNLQPDDDILCVGDFGFMYMTETWTVTMGGTEAEISHSDFILPYFRLGLEGSVTNWWDVRVGAKKYWHMYTMGLTEDIDEKFGYAETSTYLGTGLYFGNLTLDLEVDPGFVQKGPNFVSGYTGTLANRVSLTYTFGD